MLEEKQKKEPWVASRGRPVKQSNYGRYKTSVYRGEGKTFETVNITGDTPEVVQELADMAAGAEELLKAAEMLADEAMRLGNYLSSKGQGATALGAYELRLRKAVAKVTGTSKA